MKNKSSNALATASYRAGCKLDYIALAFSESSKSKEEENERIEEYITTYFDDKKGKEDKKKIEKAITESEHFDYTKKKEVMFSEILLPENCPKKYANRNILWNTIENIENKVSGGRRSKEVEVSLPNELSEKDCEAILHSFVNDNFVKKGFIADYSIHWKEEIDKKTKKKKINHHAHILIPTRMIDSKGKFIEFKSKKVWNYEYEKDKKGNEIKDDDHRIQQKDPVTNKLLWKITIDKATGKGKKEPEYRIPLIDKETGLQKVDSQNRKQWKSHKEEFNELNTTKFLVDLRKNWANECNKYLSEENKITEKSHEARITGTDYKRDERGYRVKDNNGNYIKEQIELRENEKLPEGIMPLEYVSRKELIEQEEKGIISDTIQRNIDIKEHNNLIYKLLKQIKELKDNIVEVVIEKPKEVIKEVSFDLQERLKKLKERRKEDERTGRNDESIRETTNGNRREEQENRDTTGREQANNTTKATTTGQGQSDTREKQEDRGTGKDNTGLDWRDAVNERANREDERERQRIRAEQEAKRREQEEKRRKSENAETSDRKSTGERKGNSKGMAEDNGEGTPPRPKGTGYHL